MAPGGWYFSMALYCAMALALTSLSMMPWTWPVPGSHTSPPWLRMNDSSGQLMKSYSREYCIAAPW